VKLTADQFKVLISGLRAPFANALGVLSTQPGLEAIGLGLLVDPEQQLFQSLPDVAAMVAV
jgi:hypothetical protein